MTDTLYAKHLTFIFRYYFPKVHVWRSIDPGVVVSMSPSSAGDWRRWGVLSPDRMIRVLKILKEYNEH